MTDAAQKEEIQRHLSDPIWRLTSGKLYKIQTGDGGGIIPFDPRPEQAAIFRKVLVEGKRRLLIPKARRLGMSTAIGVMMADFAIWRAATRATLIDQNAFDASKKLGEIVKVAMENLPEWLQPMLRLDKDNDRSVELSMAGQNASSVYALAGARGGTNDFLWISEWGVIQHEDPKRSAKIRSGALPSARHGVTLVETTWAGGNGGDLWELIEPVLEGSSDDWEILFFPWWVDPRNTHETAHIDEPARKYFEKIAPRLAAEGITLSEPQRRWWAMERRAQGIFMLRENPTFLDECWAAPVKGAIYAEEVERARSEGRISERMPVDQSCLVHTSWDLGSPVNVVVWYWQVIGRMIRVVDVDMGMDETLAQRVARMRARGYNLGNHHLPHDAANDHGTGSFLNELARIGLPNLVVIPRTHDVWVGINDLKELLPNLEFRLPACEPGLRALSAYHMHPKADGLTGAVRDEPVHDWSSHASDALRIMAEAVRGGFIKFAWGAGHDPANQRRDPYARPRRRPLVMRVGG